MSSYENGNENETPSAEREREIYDERTRTSRLARSGNKAEAVLV